MAILEVLKFPDPRLREVSEPIEKFDNKLKQIVSDMFETMYAENGIGLAAPQVGILQRLLVIDTRPRDRKGRYEEQEGNEMGPLESKIEQPLVVINPIILKGNGKTVFSEGCLSVPTFFEDVQRFETIELQYQDVEGKKHVITLDGLLAICVQHEIDHLEGTLFIDHLSLIKNNRIKNQIKKHGYPEKETETDKEKEDVKA